MSAQPETPPRLKLADIRPARLADLDAIYALNCAAFAEAWTREALATALATGCDFHVWPDASDQLVAYVFCQSVADELHILQLAVAAPYRRQGYAHQLCGYVLDLKRQQGVRRALLEVRASNLAAVCLYRRLAFTVIGRRHGYYAAHGDGVGREDAIVMAMAL